MKIISSKEPEIDSQLYVPRLLQLRLKRREILEVACYIHYFFNIFLFILGFIFIDSVWNTRSYIRDGDGFWDEFKVKEVKPNEIQMFCGFSGIFSILISFFNIMNNIVIHYHSHYGGLKVRLLFAQYVSLILAILHLGYSIIPIVKFNNLLILFPLLIGLSASILINAIFVFVIAGKLVRKELEYMLPYALMNIHREEYQKEFATKKRVLIKINTNLNEENQRPVDAVAGDSNRIFMNK